MPGVKRPRGFRRLSVVASFVLTVACGGAAVEVPYVEACSWVIDLEPDIELDGEILVPRGGSRRVRVHIPKRLGRDREFHSRCAYLFDGRPNWTIDDPSVARIEEYSATAALYSSWTITGLAAGETWIHLRYDFREPEVSVRLRVVES